MQPIPTPSSRPGPRPPAWWLPRGAVGTAAPSHDAEVRHAKGRLREQVGRRLRGSGPDPGADAALRAHLAAWPALRTAHTVAAFASIGGEPVLWPLLAALRRRGVRICLPAVTGPALQLRGWDGPLAAGSLGVAEPTGAVVPARAVDVALVPGLAFDRGGRRLGRGGGHYDRMLARLPRTATAVGCCHQLALVERVPVEGHDVPVDRVVTERGWWPAA